MPRTDPVTFALDSWSLGLEACSVIGMRLPILMTASPTALAEAQLMVAEKIQAAAQLQWKMMTGDLGSTGPAIASASVAHYRKAVSKNRRGLARPRGAR